MIKKSKKQQEVEKQLRMSLADLFPVSNNRKDQIDALVRDLVRINLRLTELKAVSKEAWKERLKKELSECKRNAEAELRFCESLIKVKETTVKFTLVLSKDTDVVTKKVLTRVRRSLRKHIRDLKNNVSRLKLELKDIAANIRGLSQKGTARSEKMKDDTIKLFEARKLELKKMLGEIEGFDKQIEAKEMLLTKLNS